MRFLLDTNVLIPLEDSNHVLEESLANFVRLSHEHGHVLTYHPASEDDFNRDTNVERRKKNFERIRQYTKLDNRLICPWNLPETNPNDAADNEILYSLACEAVHVLVSEDKGIHVKAKEKGLSNRVYTIQTADDWLRRLHEKKKVELPNIEDVSLHALTPNLGSDFFKSLHEDYDYDVWFRNKARDGRRAWVTWQQPDILGALCIYSQQNDERITKEGLVLKGPALKLCTFKVSEAMQGRKIGELFLKAAFRYATDNRLENIFIHGDKNKHYFLFEMLKDFGFSHVGSDTGSNGRDVVYLKRHPVSRPDDNQCAFEYMKNYFPHFKHDNNVGKYIVPIQSKYHQILFPDYQAAIKKQLNLFAPENFVGNAIKLAYLCHAQTKQINPGDVVLFYRSQDEKAITSIGVVENYDTLQDVEAIARYVKRRTVYSMDEITEMAKKTTRVMLFRVIKHLKTPLRQDYLKKNNILQFAPQSITKIPHDTFERIMASAE